MQQDIFPLSRFKDLFASLPDLYLILTADLTIVAVSDAYLQATMTRRQDIIGRGVFEVFPDNPDDHAATGTLKLRASLQKVLVSGAPHVMEILKYDIRRPEAEGGEFEERYWTPVNIPVLDAEGQVAYIINRVEDVTAIVRLKQQQQEHLQENQVLRQRAEKLEAETYARVQDSESKLRRLVDTVLDTIIDGVITLNHRGNIQSFNKACTGLFGYTPEEALGKNISMLLQGDYPKNYKDIMEISREVSGRRKDGSVFPMEFAVGETHHGGEHAYVGIIRDITDRHEAEKAREQLRQAQKMESLGQLTGGIAHDFNNLLAVILGNLDFMDEKLQEGDALRNFIRPSIEAAEHGAELTKQLLAFGRKQALQPKIISVNELLERFSTLVKHALGERIEVILSLADDLWSIHADPSQLQNALLNLAVNARDAMPQGGKLIFETRNVILDEEYASLNADVIPGDYIMVAVSDIGEGMTPEVLEKAFEPFFTTKDIGKGSGLGLSMVYGFVKQSAGHIKLYSEPGMGTSVKIYLRRTESFAVPRDREIPKIYASQENREKLVLVVEDNAEVLTLTSSMVESLGYKVIVSRTGDAAMKIIEARDDIDLLLSDVMLPGILNGPMLAKHAMALRPNLKVLFNSGYAEHAMLQSGILEEGVHLLSKPFRKTQLADKIEEVLKG